MALSERMLALVVDDDPMWQMIIENILRRMGYDVLIANNGREATYHLTNPLIHLVITDWDMPEMTGLELCRTIRRGDYAGYIYIVMITSNNTEEQKLEGLSAGADAFITKPFKPTELLVCLKTAERILSLETCELAIFALARLAESRDSETGKHIERVQRYTRLLAQQLSTTEKFRELIDDSYIRLLHQTSPLHDIGKVGIPDSILLKQGHLSTHEKNIMKSHAVIGAETLNDAVQRFPSAKFLRMARDIAGGHHERFDGKGYPAGVAGENIPLAARIVALADVYDALTSWRVYKAAMPHDRAKELIIGERGAHFDPDVVAAFLDRENDFRTICEALRDSADAPLPMPQNSGPSLTVGLAACHQAVDDIRTLLCNVQQPAATPMPPPGRGRR